MSLRPLYSRLQSYGVSRLQSYGVSSCRRSAWAPLLAIALVLAGCPGKASHESGTQADLQRSVPAVAGVGRALAGTTIRYFAYAPGTAAVLDRALAERFERDTGIEVALNASAQTTDEIFAAYQALFAAKLPDYDVLMLDVIWPGALAPHLRDLAPALAESAAGAWPQIVRNNTIDGKLVAMPYYADAGMLFYRTDLLVRYGFDGPPDTWDALERMAATIQAGERRNTPDFAGFVWQGRAYEGLTCNALEWQASHGGGELFQADTGAANVANPQAVAAFGRAAGWLGTISPRAVLGYDEEDARKHFQSGKAAFMRNWPYAYAAGHDEASPIKGRFEATALPHAERVERGAATLGGWQLGVSAYSRQPASAMAFVKYLSSPEVQKWRAIEGAFLPTHRAVYEDAEVQAIGPFMATVPSVLELAIARPSNRTQARYGRVSRLYYSGVSDILHGAAPQATAVRMQAELQALIK